MQSPAADLRGMGGDPVASAAGECRRRMLRAGLPPPPRASAARACLGIAPCGPGLTLPLAGMPWPFAFGGTAPVAESCPLEGLRLALEPAPCPRGCALPGGAHTALVRGDKDV